MLPVVIRIVETCFVYVANMALRAWSTWSFVRSFIRSVDWTNKRMLMFQLWNWACVKFKRKSLSNYIVLNNPKRVHKHKCARLHLHLHIHLFSRPVWLCVCECVCKWVWHDVYFREPLCLCLCIRGLRLCALSQSKCDKITRSKAF